MLRIADNFDLNEAMELPAAGQYFAKKNPRGKASSSGRKSVGWNDVFWRWRRLLIWKEQTNNLITMTIMKMIMTVKTFPRKLMKIMDKIIMKVIIVNK